MLNVKLKFNYSIRSDTVAAICFQLNVATIREQCLFSWAGAIEKR